MEFCSRCGTAMFPRGGFLECKNCGYKKEITKELISKYEVPQKISSKESIIFTDSKIKTLPTTRVICPKCKNREAFWWLQQTRRADESETRFLRCTSCGFTWREYD
ncbi:MAG: transcription factor S [Euryarchaeota archaeon]|nr:transcription factor S [Euryarchaeota archaeon]